METTDGLKTFPVGEADVVWVPQLQDVPGERVHDSCTKALVHEVDAAQTSLFRVSPGGAVRSHVHTEIWDLFVCLDGEGVISFNTPDGVRSVPMSRGAFLAMPPQTTHQVENRSEATEFVFLLIHAPWEGYDHKPSELDAATAEG